MAFPNIPVVLRYMVEKGKDLAGPETEVPQKIKKGDEGKILLGLQGLESQYKKQDMIYPKSYIVWDLETTGLDPKKDKIIEIGAMKISEGKVEKEKSWILDHGIKLSDTTVDLTGITQEMVDGGDFPEMVYAEFLAWFDTNYANVTHNGYRFDLPFLFNAISPEQKSQYEMTFLKGCVDTAVIYKAQKLNMDQMWNENFLAFSRRVMDVRAFGVKYNIPLCCDELGIDKEGVTLHRALGDVGLTNEIYKKLCL